MEIDEKFLAEEAATSPSEETTSPEATPVVAEEKIEKAVPYNRFKEVVEERNKYKELLSVTPPAAKAETPVNENYEEAIKVIDTRVEEKIQHKLDLMSRQMELDRTIKDHPDFFQYADLIKTKVQDNPHLSWADAYKLSRYEASLVQAKEIGKKEAYRKIEEKKAATVETAAKAKSAADITSGEIDPLAKTPDGKFIHSLKDLEDILPKK